MPGTQSSCLDPLVWGQSTMASMISPPSLWPNSQRSGAHEGTRLTASGGSPATAVQKLIQDENGKRLISIWALTTWNFPSVAEMM